MSEVERYDWDEEGMLSEFSGYKDIEGHWVKSSDYDTLAAQRDEGLAREAELNRRISALEGDGSWGEMALTVKVDTLQQRLAEADRKYDEAIAEMQAVIDTGALTASEHESLEAEICARITDYWKRPTKPGPGCADGEKTE